MSDRTVPANTTPKSHDACSIIYLPTVGNVSEWDEPAGFGSKADNPPWAQEAYRVQLGEPNGQGEEQSWE